MLECSKATRIIPVAVALVCDKCGKRVPVEDWAEYQDFLRWEFLAGYASVWGDGNKVKLDLCPSCTKALLEKFAQVSPLGGMNEGDVPEES